MYASATVYVCFGTVSTANIAVIHCKARPTYAYLLHCLEFAVASKCAQIAYLASEYSVACLPASYLHCPVSDRRRLHITLSKCRARFWALIL